MQNQQYLLKSSIMVIGVTLFIMGFLHNHVTAAETPDDGAIITVCLNQHNGRLRVVSTASLCKNQERVTYLTMAFAPTCPCFDVDDLSEIEWTQCFVGDKRRLLKLQTDAGEDQALVQGNEIGHQCQLVLSRDLINSNQGLFDTERRKCRQLIQAQITKLDMTCDAVGDVVELGSIQGTIGGGQFTFTTAVPTGIFVGYGYGQIDASLGQYIFDNKEVSTAGGIIDIGIGDDPEFASLVDATFNGPPPGNVFFTGFGFSPSPPFNRLGVFTSSSQILVPPGSNIEFFRLKVDPFTITGSPAPGDETLWEIPTTNIRISAHGHL